MKQTYLKDKTVKITFRCDESLGNWLIHRSKQLDMTPSALVRQMMFQNYYAECVLNLHNKTVSTETAAKHENK